MGSFGVLVDTAVGSCSGSSKRTPELDPRPHLSTLDPSTDPILSAPGKITATNRSVNTFFYSTKHLKIHKKHPFGGPGGGVLYLQGLCRFTPQRTQLAWMSAPQEKKKRPRGADPELRERLRLTLSQRTRPAPPLSRPPEMVEYGERVVNNQVALSYKRSSRTGKKLFAPDSARAPALGMAGRIQSM